MILEEELNENMNLREILNYYIKYWKYFVFSVLTFTLLCFIYLKYTKPVYTVTSSILVKDDENGISDQLNAFSEIGFDLNGSNLKIENEIELLKSRFLLTSVVENLNLNINYFDNNSLFKKELYKNLPIKVSIINNKRSYKQTDFLVEIKKVSNSKLKITDKKNSKVYNYSLGESISTFLGEIVITPTAYYNYNDFNLLLSITNVDNAVNSLQKSLNVELVNKESSILSLSLNSSNIDKGKAILNTLMNNHSKDAINDKVEISVSTLKFIKNRINFLTSELSNVENDVSKFKSKNKIINFETDAELFIEKESENQKLLSENQIQIELNEFVLNHIKTSKTDELLPYNIGISNKAIDDLISNINSLIIERNRLLTRSSANNPIAINIDNQVASLKSNLKESLIGNKKSLKITKDLLITRQQNLDEQLNSAPNQEKDFREISRQQQIKETLYLFLLQKREETSLQLAVATSNTKLIDKAYCNGTPISPNKKVYYLLSILLGVLIPFIFLYVIKLFNNKIQNSDDIKFLNIPFLGDLPLVKQNVKNIFIEKGDRSSLAEAFRLIRTNINFMLSNVSGSKTIFITSTYGSEGKSFASINLAKTLALTDKKVLLIGLDLRLPKLSEYLDENHSQGVSNYIVNNNLKFEDIIFNSSKIEGVDIIFSGIIPPNPSELLLNNRINELFTYAKEHYDYIIVDTAPVGLVTDTFLLKDFADLTIYMTRANYLEKKSLSIVKEIHLNKKLKNITLLLNGVDFGYTYGQSKGYGYGNYIDQSTKKSFFNFFKSN